MSNSISAAVRTDFNYGDVVEIGTDLSPENSSKRRRVRH